jgi:type VI secretion system Hcp family effector
MTQINIQNHQVKKTTGTIPLSPDRSFLPIALTILLFLSSLPLALAQQEYIVLLNIENGAIPGNSTVQGFEGQTVVLNVSFGVSQAGVWEEGEEISGRDTSFHEMKITKVQDNGSPILAQASALKTQFNEAVLTLFVVDGDSQVFMTARLEKVIITSVGSKLFPGEAIPSEVFTLSYRRAFWKVDPEAEKGFDLDLNDQALTSLQSSALTAPTTRPALLNSTTEPGSTDSNPLRRTNKRTKTRRPR